MASFNLRDNLLGFPQLTHIQRTYNWDFLLPDLFGVLVSGLVISKYCQAIRFGQYDITDLEEIRAGALRKTYPTGTSIETVSATFVTPVPDLVLWFFSNWKDKIVDKKGRFKIGDEYKKTGTLVLYDRTGIPCNIIRLLRMFPVKFPGFNMAYGTEDAHKYEVTFRVEKTEMGFTALGSVINDVTNLVGGIFKKPAAPVSQPIYPAH